jgi:methylmalonyl-CoA mutase cobalamin-binding domain/chain
MSIGHHSIQSVARRTGLTPHVIRIWEKRYAAVQPTRTETNRRLYSDAEVERLQMLRRAIEAGHSIGAIAGLEDATLATLADAAPAPAAAATTTAQAPDSAQLVNNCIAATKSLDALALDESLRRGAATLGQRGLLEHVIAPVAQTLGELWRDGAITAAHEHFASAAIRGFLSHAARPFALPANAPNVIVTTPAGQLHELGAVMAAAAAADMGWRVTYLGTSLPAAEIAGSAMQNKSRAVALSIVYPTDDEFLPAELKKLREYLPGEISIIVGGRAAPAYAQTLRQIGAIQSSSLREFTTQLDNLRLRPAA